MTTMRLTRQAFLATTGAAAALPAMPRLAQAARLPLSPIVSVKIGIIGALFDVGSIVAFERGYFKEEGLDVNLQAFPGSAEASQAFAIGGVDAISSGPNPMIFNAKSRNLKIAIVAGAGQHSPGHGAISLILRKDLIDSGRYRSPADLKGMKIASGLLTPSNWFVEEFARRGGAPDSSVEIVPLGLPNTVEALANKALDGGCINEPSASLLLQRSNGVRIANMDAFAPNFPSGWLLFGSSLLNENVEAGKRFMVAYLRGVRDYREAYAGSRRGLPALIVLLKKYDMLVTDATPSLGFPADGKPSFVGVDQFAQWQLAHGTIKQLPDMTALNDRRFLAYASGEGAA
jgi:NitT/TauT family transport system substrate-binding protein